jgi:hypothetical protein
MQNLNLIQTRSSFMEHVAGTSYCSATPTSRLASRSGPRLRPPTSRFPTPETPGSS